MEAYSTWHTDEVHSERYATWPAMIHIEKKQRVIFLRYHRQLENGVKFTLQARHGFGFSSSRWNADGVLPLDTGILKVVRFMVLDYSLACQPLGNEKIVLLVDGRSWPFLPPSFSAGTRLPLDQVSDIRRQFNNSCVVELFDVTKRSGIRFSQEANRSIPLTAGNDCDQTDHYGWSGCKFSTLAHWSWSKCWWQLTPAERTIHTRPRYSVSYQAHARMPCAGFAFLSSMHQCHRCFLLRYLLWRYGYGEVALRTSLLIASHSTIPTSVRMNIDMLVWSRLFRTNHWSVSKEKLLFGNSIPYTLQFTEKASDHRPFKTASLFWIEDVENPVK